MRLGDKLNLDRVNSLKEDVNAYVGRSKNINSQKVKTQSAEKIIFPEPYENANSYYNKNNFGCRCDEESNCEKPPVKNNQNMFDVKSILPMLMSGKFNDMLTPLMSLLGGGSKGGSGMDFAKIFELFKPKQKAKKVEKEEVDISSKFDDFIIIEDYL